MGAVIAQHDEILQELIEKPRRPQQGGLDGG
jgi:hypothetical protein